MKYVLIFSLLLFELSCNSKEDTKDEITMLQPDGGLTKEAIAIKAAITEVESKFLETAGEIKKSLQIDGMEVIKISMKDYLIEEKKSQEVNFANYIKYLDRFKNTKSPLNNPATRTESQAKHNAVISYLNQLIKKASATDKVYKVVYHLNAVTTAHTFNQLKTTYLGENYNKLSVSYLHLKSLY